MWPPNLEGDDTRDESEVDVSGLVECVHSPVCDVAMATKPQEWYDNLLCLWHGGVGCIEVLQRAGGVQTRKPQSRVT